MEVFEGLSPASQENISRGPDKIKSSQVNFLTPTTKEVDPIEILFERSIVISQHKPGILTDPYFLEFSYAVIDLIVILRLVEG